MEQMLFVILQGPAFLLDLLELKEIGLAEFPHYLGFFSLHQSIGLLPNLAPEVLDFGPVGVEEGVQDLLVGSLGDWRGGDGRPFHRRLVFDSLFRLFE